MSLKITNKLTAKQRDILERLEYIGTWNLTIEEAGKIIDELFVEQKMNYRQIDEIAHDYYNNPEQ